MSQPLTEKPSAEQVPFSASAAVVLDGRYLPPPQDKDGKIWARASAIIQANSDELYALWRGVENAPKWQEQITSVRQTSDVISHWIMESDGEKMEWDSEILADEPGKRIAWRSIGGDSSNAGEVIFDPAPGDRGTLVTVLQEFRIGKIANAWETIVGRNPEQSEQIEVERIEQRQRAVRHPLIGGLHAYSPLGSAGSHISQTGCVCAINRSRSYVTRFC